MGNIFSVRPGVAISLKNLDAVPITFGLLNWGGYPIRRSVIQTIQVSSQGNFQFLSTLRNYIYVYVFGEKPGNMVLTGTMFRGDCGLLVDGWSTTMNYYANQAISTTGSPVPVQIGASGFYAFLTGANFKILRPEFNIGQFVFSFTTLPQ